jgi:hypothetical protein
MQASSRECMCMNVTDHMTKVVFRCPSSEVTGKTPACYSRLLLIDRHMLPAGRGCRHTSSAGRWIGFRPGTGQGSDMFKIERAEMRRSRPVPLWLQEQLPSGQFRALYSTRLFLGLGLSQMRVSMTHQQRQIMYNMPMGRIKKSS